MKCAVCRVPCAVFRVQCVKVCAVCEGVQCVKVSEKVSEKVSDFKGDEYPFQWEVKSRGFHFQVSFVHAEMR